MSGDYYTLLPENHGFTKDDMHRFFPGEGAAVLHDKDSDEFKKWLKDDGTKAGYLKLIGDKMSCNDMGWLLKNVYGVKEPFFTIRAKDVSSLGALSNYRQQAEIQGASQEFLTEVDVIMDEFKTWQIDNADKVKIPD